MSASLSRIVVVLALAPAVLYLGYRGGWWWFALGALGALIALDEFWRLARANGPLALAGYLGTALTLVGAQQGGIEWAVGGFLTTLPLAFCLKVVSPARQAPTAAISTTVLGSTWVGLGVAFLLLVRALPSHGRLALFTLLLAVWAGDTLAYFGGRLFGRHKMAPSTSPGKTWEGFVFGTAATIFVTFEALYNQHFLSISDSIVLGAVIAVAAPLGDLFESLLKRDAGVKDSGRLLGGHGGMLDRLDAFLFAAPAAYFAILALT